MLSFFLLLHTAMEPDLRCKQVFFVSPIVIVRKEEDDICGCENYYLEPDVDPYEWVD